MQRKYWIKYLHLAEPFVVYLWNNGLIHGKLKPKALSNEIFTFGM